MTRSTVVRVLGIFAGLLLAANVLSALTAANTVPPTRLGNLPADAISVTDLRPNQCDAIAVTAIRMGSGTFGATNGADLVLGSEVVDNISAGGGNDCLVAGAGNDSMNGGNGTDVCIGGPGTDTFNNNCETRIQ